MSLSDAWVDFRESFRHLRSNILLLKGSLVAILLLISLFQLFQIFKIFYLKPPHDFNRYADMSAQKKTEKSNALSNLHLFGQTPPPPPQAQVPVVRVKWIIRGIIVGSQMDQNRVILATGPTDEAIYKKGDILSDGSIVLNVFADRVLLGFNKNSETLLLDDTSNPPSVSPGDANQVKTFGKKFSIMGED